MVQTAKELHGSAQEQRKGEARKHQQTVENSEKARKSIEKETNAREETTMIAMQKMKAELCKVTEDRDKINSRLTWLEHEEKEMTKT